MSRMSTRQPRRPRRRRSPSTSNSTAPAPRTSRRVCRSSTTCWPNSASTPGSTCRSRPRATSTSTRTTRWRTSRSSSVRRWPRRSATRPGVRRFASILLPLDEALVEVALDLSGRPFCVYEVDLGADVLPLGTPPFDPHMAEQFFQSFATAAAHHAARAHARRSQHPSHPRGRVQGRGALPARRGADRGRRRAVDQGHALIAVLDYGIGNLRSAEKALQRVGADARLVSSVDDAAGAAGVVLPGVGNFGRCIEALRAVGLDRVALDAVDGGHAVPRHLRRHADAVRGVRGVAGRRRARCAARRRPPAAGLGEAAADAVERAARRRVPTARCSPGCGDVPWMYFLHSYAPEKSDDVVATCDYGGPVVAAVERANVWATQFHPEKSGAAGLQLLRNFAGALRGVALMDLYPAIDLRDGRCVRLHQGDFDRETIYDDDPIARAKAFDAAGARGCTSSTSTRPEGRAEPRRRRRHRRRGWRSRCRPAAACATAAPLARRRGARRARQRRGRASPRCRPHDRRAPRQGRGRPRPSRRRSPRPGLGEGAGVHVLDALTGPSSPAAAAFIITNIGRDATLDGPGHRRPGQGRTGGERTRCPRDRVRWCRRASTTCGRCATRASRGVIVGQGDLRGALHGRGGGAGVRTVRVIPCLDVDAGRVVKGVNFVDLQEAGDPVVLAARYDEMGADEVIFLDITASSDNRDTMVDVVRRTADEVFIPLTVGGGVRTVDDARALLRAGADKVSVMTSAIAASGAGGRAGARVRIPVRRGGDRRAAHRRRRLRGVHPRRAYADGHRRDLVGGDRRAARRRRDPPHVDGPRRHQGRLRPRAHAGDHDRMQHSRHRQWRRGNARPPRRGSVATAGPTQCSRHRSSTSASSRSRRPRSTWLPPDWWCARAREAGRRGARRWSRGGRDAVGTAARPSLRRGTGRTVRHRGTPSSPSTFARLSLPRWAPT